MKNQSVQSNYSKPQPVRTKLCTHAQIKRRQHTGIFGHNRPS